MKKAPCVDCERKGCGSYHDQCEKYREYWTECDRVRKEKLKRKKFSDVLNSVYRNSTKSW